MEAWNKILHGVASSLILFIKILTTYYMSSVVLGSEDTEIISNLWSQDHSLQKEQICVCLCIYICMHVRCLVAQSCLTFCDPIDCSLPSSSVHEDSPDKNTEVGCHSLLQGIFLAQGSNPGLPHCRQILHRLSHQGSPYVCIHIWYEVKWSEVKLLSHVWLFVTLWTVAYQDPQFMGFSRQEYWSGLPFPSPGDLPDLGIEPRSPALQADSFPSEPPGKPTWYMG